MPNVAHRSDPGPLPLDVIPLERKAHRNFALKSWVKTLRRLPNKRGIDPNWLCAAGESLIKALFASPRVVTLAAVNPDNHDHLYGFIVGEPERRVLHFVYTKESLRSQPDPEPKGLCATQLMGHMFGEPGEAIEITEQSRDLRWLQRWNLRPRTYRICEAIR